MIAGALTGPLVLLPGLAFLLSLAAFYPAILSSPLPVSYVLDALGHPVLNAVIQAVILGALIKTAVGLLHGLNERLSRAASDKQWIVPRWFRPAFALVVMLIAIFGAAMVGLVDLIASGYRFSAVYFLCVFVIPLLTVGVALAWKSRLGAG